MAFEAKVVFMKTHADVLNVASKVPVEGATNFMVTQSKR